MSGRSGNQLVLFSLSPACVARENTAYCIPQNLTFSVYYCLFYITSKNWKKRLLPVLVFIKRLRQGNSFVLPYIQTLLKCIAMFWLRTVKGFSVQIGSKLLK